MDERIRIHVEPRYVKEEDWNGQRIRPFQKEALEAIKKSNARIIVIDALSKEIKDLLENIQNYLIERFQNNFKCLILYGSWAKGTAKSSSDIDLLAVFRRLDKEIGRSVHDIIRSVETERNITIIPTNLEDFQKEKLPLYTAIKREGRLIYGDVDLSRNPEPVEVKYSEFFKRSYKFESQKIEIAQELLERNLTSGIAEFCFVASKHAIQAALAMKGKGYSSKIAVLSPLTEKYLGREIALVFRKLFELYVKSEYGMEFLSNEELKLAIKYAKDIQGVYLSKPAEDTNKSM